MTTTTPAVRTWTFDSKSEPGVRHTTAVAADGAFSCTCKGYYIRRTGKPAECSHITGLFKQHPAWTRVVVGETVYALGDPRPTPVQITPPPPAEPTDAPPHPMLAAPSDHTLTGAAFDRRYANAAWTLEVKLDGHRVLVVKRGDTVEAWSRPSAGETPLRRTLPPEVVAALRRMPDGTYDGELIATGDGPARSWQVVRPDLWKQLVLFDALEVLGEHLLGKPYTYRRAVLTLAIAHQGALGTVSLVPAVAPSWAAVEAIWAAGQEGAILKRVASTYRPGYRSADWVKVKRLEQHTVTITGFAAGENGPYSRILIAFADGTPSKAKTKNAAWRKLFAADPARYLGQQLVIECQLRTDSGKPRHVMAKRFVQDHLGKAR